MKFLNSQPHFEPPTEVPSMLSRSHCLMTFVALVSLLAPSGSAEKADVNWKTVLFDCASLAECKTEGNFRVLPDGGPNGAPAVLFDEPMRTSGKLEIDLSRSGIDLSRYDQLRFDLLIEHGLVNVMTTLWGHPDEQHCRNYYVSKRFIRLGEWDSVHLDLDLDDDARDKGGEPPLKVLKFGFAVGKTGPEKPGVYPQARVANVRLVRTPVKASIDTMRVVTEETAEGLFFHHPLRLSNHAGREVTASISVVPEALEHFQVRDCQKQVSLQEGESRATDLCLWLPKERASELPAGHVERALAKVQVREIPGYEVLPNRGYRPIYLFAMVPPRRDRAAWMPKGAKPDARLQASLESSLGWRFEAPFHVLPKYEDHFRCKGDQCGHRLRARNITTYYCGNTRCARQGKEIRVTPEHPLFAAYLGTYHMTNAKLARDYAVAFLGGGEKRFGEKAKEILLTYASVLEKLPIISSRSTGRYCRLTSASLFEKGPLVDFAEAYLLVSENGLASPEELETIRTKLLLPVLYSVNLHFYGTSSGQVGLTTAVAKAALATGNYYYLADALAGDCGVRVMLDRTFDADGVGVEGGAYAMRAARRMGVLAEFLDAIGVDTDRERLEHIMKNTEAVFRTGAPDASLVLPDTGFTILVNGKEDDRVKVTVNWGRSRGRGEYDLLSYHLEDNRGPLIGELGRIAYGNPFCFLMYTTFAHSVPVINEQNLNPEPMVQEYFHSDEDAAVCLISDRAETPAYRGARVTRALVLFEGCLLVVDRVVSAKPVMVDLPLYGEGTLSASAGEMVDLGIPLGKTKHYAVPTRLRISDAPRSRFEAQWTCREKRDPVRLALRFLGDEASIITGKTRGGWTAQERDLLLVRKHGSQFLGAALYEAVRDKHASQIKEWSRLKVSSADHGSADGPPSAAYRITFTDGRQAEILISFDGHPHTTDHCQVSAARRIAVFVAKTPKRER